MRRRAVEREPVAYITGVRGFRHLDLHVDARVLVPRPETETLVEAALDLPRGARVVDVGTGSGAVALALKDERPDLHVTGTDVSDDALAVARANAQRLGLDVAFARADLLDGAPDADAVVSNPPYVEDGAPLAPEITRHEPHVALFAGADGLAIVRTLVEQAAARGVAFLALEIGMGQAPAVALLMRAAGFARTETRARPGRDRAGGRRVALTAEDARTFARCMSVGGVAVFPADTVYGLACEPDSKEAVTRLYRLKGRVPDKPAAVMFFALDLALAALPELGPRTELALRTLLPGPVTLLLPNPAGRFPLACATDLGTLGVRVPALPPALAALAGRPLAGAAVQRERRRRPRRPHARRRARADPRPRRPRARRRRAARARPRRWSTCAPGSSTPASTSCARAPRRRPRSRARLQSAA